MHDDTFKNIYKDLAKATRITEDDIKNLGTAFLNVQKVGFKMPISWEELYGNERKGHYEPVGVKWIQWVTWGIGFVVFKAWVGLEKALVKSRHFQGVNGFEWEAAEYLPFKQKTRWVEDDE